MASTHSIRIAEAGERVRAFRRARLNSAVVRALRWLLPAGAVCLLGSYALFMQLTIAVETSAHAGRIDTGTVSKMLDNLAMTNPSYEGYNRKDGSRYKVSAAKAITDLSRDKPVELHGIAGSFRRPNGQDTVVTATHGVFDQTRGTLKLDKGIRIEAPGGVRVSMNSATIDTKATTLVSRQPVKVELPSGEVRSNAMQLDQRARAIQFAEGVAARLLPTRGAPTADGKAASQSANMLPGLGAGSRSPVDVTAATLSISEKERTAEFSGNVRAAQDGRVLRAPALTVAFERASLFDPSRPVGELRDATPTTGRLRQIVAKDGVELTDRGNRITARTAIFDAETNRGELIGDVEIQAPGRRSMKADHALIEQASNEIVMTGEVVARLDGSLLKGRRMVYQPRHGHVRLTAPARKNGAPAERIFVRFQPPARSQSSRSAPSAGGTQMFATNPDAPIEITAAALDVRDAEAQARFDGGVRARQGELLLVAPVLTAHYSGRIGLANAADQKKTPATPTMKLRLIRAERPVEVSSGDDMRANGERAEFDMLANTVTITGNVVLKQGRQIVRGEHLVIDVKTGLARMKNAGPDKNQRRPLQFGPAPQITANPLARDCGGQMCAVFYPKDVRAKRSGAAAAPKPGTRVLNGWTTTTGTN